MAAVSICTYLFADGDFKQGLIEGVGLKLYIEWFKRLCIKQRQVFIFCPLFHHMTPVGNLCPDIQLT